MPFIGNQPALSYTSFAKQDFTTSATTSYTLDNPVANANELALFINFVRQEPTTAYTASGTSLTLTSATSASDDMYCVFLGKAVQTVNPPNGSVGTAQLADSSVSLAKLSATGTKDSTTFLRVDNTFAVAGGDNTPSFSVTLSGNQGSIPATTWTKLNFASEYWDTDNAFASNKFTVPSGKDGKYYFGYTTRLTSIDDGESVLIKLYKNGNAADVERSMANQYVSVNGQNVNVSGFYAISASASDYFEVYVYHYAGAAVTAESGASVFFGYKLIGV